MQAAGAAQSLDRRRRLAHRHGPRLFRPLRRLYAEGRPRDIAIPGANTDTANRLHLFDVEAAAPEPEVGIDFDKSDIAHVLTAFLYPDDSDDAGRLLRVYQQYFMVSAGAQLILGELEERGFALRCWRSMPSFRSTTPTPP